MPDDYNKKVVFWENDKVHADLKIKTHYDGISQSDFFRGCIRAYLEEEGSFMAFLGELKEKRSQLSKTIRKVANRDQKGSQEQVQNFGLSHGEVEDIFDILEKEYEDM
tara:strand:+ start:617 stop:940 length:324 start_codon:yes stop_codon:yes gene_type:complete